MDLYQVPEFTVEPDSGTGSHRFRAGQDGQGTVLALGAPVSGLPESRYAGLLATAPNDGRDRSRHVVRVDRPDGGPLFFVDRAERLPNVMIAPTAVVAPNGQVIGRIEHRLTQPNVNAYTLSDAAGRPLCEALASPLRMVAQSTGNPRIIGGDEHVYTDSGGNQIARLEARSHGLVNRGRYSVLRLHRALPEPTRTLVLASPLAISLMGMSGMPM